MTLWRWIGGSDEFEGKLNRRYLFEAGTSRGRRTEGVERDAEGVNRRGQGKGAEGARAGSVSR